jgi:hypothetical protein
MDFDTNALLASLLIGSIGTVLFMYGKRQSRLPHMLVGVTMFFYPYFVPGAALSLAICAVLSAGLWAAVKYLGW